MTTVAFHFHVKERLPYVCRLLRKAVAAQTRVVVTGPADTLSQLDRDLWTFAATEFVPHCMADATPAMLQQSPVVLTTSLEATPVRSVLVNLLDAVPAGFEPFERVIEVVDTDPQARHFARQRWRHYASAGLELVQHDLSQRGAA